MTSIPERDLDELRHALRRVMRGFRHRRHATPDLEALVSGEPPLGPRHVAVLAHVATVGPRTVGEIAEDLGLSLPAASKLTRELEDHALVRRSEHVDDRRRTVVELNALTSERVAEWLKHRSAPLEQALAQLSATERAAFVKGLRALGDALMEESACGPVRSHHRHPHRRGPHRHRPV
jgi:DNA-binding MarR family transcriptional regulator